MDDSQPTNERSDVVGLLAVCHLGVSKVILVSVSVSQ
jgi:hypothetical protein